MNKHTVQCPKCRCSIEVDCVPEPKHKAPESMKDALARLKAEEDKRKNATLGSMTDALEKKRRASEDKFSRELDRIKRDKDDTPPERPFDYD